MKISFLQTEKYLFDATKFVNEKFYNVKKSKILSILFFLIIFSGSLIYKYYHGESIYAIIFSAIFFLIFIFLYDKFFEYSYEKKLRNFVEKTRKDEFGKKIFIEIKENYFLEYDEEKDFEYKLNLKNAEKIETKEYFYFYFKLGWIFFIPKEILKEEELEELKEIFKK